MAFDVKAFLSEIGLPAEDQTPVLALFEKHKPVAEKIAARFNEVDTLKTSLATEKSTLATQKATLDAEIARVNGEWETLQSIRGGDATAIAEVEKRAEALAVKSTQLESRIRKMAGEAGLNADDYLKDLTIEPVVKKPATQVDSTMAYTREDVERLANQKALVALKQSAVIMDIGNKHLILFGKPLVNSADLITDLQAEVTRTQNPNLTLTDVWEKKYEVQKKRDEQAASDLARQIKEAEERGAQRTRDELALKIDTTPAPQFVGSPALAALGKDSAVKIQGVPDGVAAAILAYRKIKAEAKTAA